MTPWLGVGAARENGCAGRRFLELFGAVPHGVFSGSKRATVLFEGDLSVLWSSFSQVILGES